MLPNPSMSFSPFAILTAEEMNDLVENIESLSDGSGLEDDAITSAKIAAGTFLKNGCYLYKDVAQSIATASDTAITFASELFDPQGMHDNSVNTSRITVPATGTYMAIAAIQWGDSTLGDYRIMTFIKNASTSILSNRSTKDSQGRASNSASVPVALSSGDYMSIRAIHNIGSNLDITAATLSLVRVG